MKNYWYRTGMLTLGLFALVGCSTSSNGTSQTSGATTESQSATLEQELHVFSASNGYIVLDYLDYDKIFVGRNDVYANDPRYAHVTPDGLVDWRQEFQGEERPDLPQFFEHITVNGKPITLPTTFGELDPEFAAFSEMDLSNVREENLSVIFKNNANQHKVKFDVSETPEEDHLVSILNENQAKINVFFQTVNLKPGKIYGLHSDISKLVTSYDVRISGIGVGSTLNEMYAVFGKPSKILDFSGAERRRIDYHLNDGQYAIAFFTTKKLPNPFTQAEGEIYDNIITGIYIAKSEQQESGE